MKMKMMIMMVMVMVMVTVTDGCDDEGGYLSLLSTSCCQARCPSVNPSILG